MSRLVTVTAVISRQRVESGDNTWCLASWASVLWQLASDWSGPLIGQLLPHYRDHMRRSDRDQALLVATGDYNHVGLTVKSNALIANFKLGPWRHGEESVLQSTCHDQVCDVLCPRDHGLLSLGATPCLPIWDDMNSLSVSLLPPQCLPWPPTIPDYLPGPILASDWSGVTQPWPLIGPQRVRRQLQVSQLVEQLHSIYRRTFGNISDKYTLM